MGENRNTIACLSDQMSRAQALRLRRLSEEAYQPGQYAREIVSRSVV